jgi:hypothetical protein
MYKILITSIFLLFIGCSSKAPLESKSSVVIFKTPQMKFYDKGFINYFDDHIHLQIFAVGNVVLDLKIYKDEICQSTFECMQAKQFNKKYLHSSYKEDFLYNLFLQKNIYHKDRKNGILIKVKE